MRVVKIDAVEEIPLGEATPIAGWTGGSVTRSRQPIIPDGDSENYRCSVVNFSMGSTTGWHKHTCDQILIVTAGSGIEVLLPVLAEEFPQTCLEYANLGLHLWPVNDPGGSVPRLKRPRSPRKNRRQGQYANRVGHHGSFVLFCWRSCSPRSRASPSS